MSINVRLYLSRLRKPVAVKLEFDDILPQIERFELYFDR